MPVLLFAFFNSNATDYYVSKTGNDTNPGTESQPFLTLNKAASLAQAGDVVYIFEGTYRETLTPANSGSLGNPITFQSVDGQKVIISALEEVNGFAQDAGSRYKATLDWDLGPRMFVLNGSTPMDLARWPNNTDNDRFSINGRQTTGGSSRDDLNSNTGYLLGSGIPDLPWENGGTVFFYGDSRWYAWRLPITDFSGNRVDFEFDGNFAVKAHAPGRGGEFFLQGIKEALDYENEWYFDSNTKEMFIQLPGGEAPVDGSIQVSRRENAIDFNKKSYIEVKNLAVIGGSVIMSGNNNKLFQVSSFYGAMSTGSNAQSLFTSIGAVVVPWSNPQWKNNVIQKCEIAYNDGSGVRVVGDNTLVDNNYIHDCDYLGTYEAAILGRDGTGTKVLNNTVKRSGRDCIQIINKGSEVGFNDFSQSNLIADDCGLLYTINKNLNIDIHHNWFHDTQAKGNLYKAAGIYLDNDASDVRVYRNVVWNVEWTTVQINWDGINIDVFNNTFANIGRGTMGAWHKAGTAFSDVRVWNNLTTEDSGPDLTWEPQSDQQNNLINATSFVDSNGDFRLTDGSAAVDAGREIAGFTEGFVGSAPDVGAYEIGDDWIPGISWNFIEGPNNTCYDLPGEACGGIRVTSISVGTEQVTLPRIGATTKLSATVQPIDALLPDVIWSSENAEIATVSRSGLITAVALGTTTITATSKDGGFSADVIVNVEDVVSIEDELNKEGILIYPNPLDSHIPLTVDLGRPNMDAIIKIFDSNGRVVNDLEGSDKMKLKRDMFQGSGLYLLNIQFSDGSRSIKQLVIR